MRDLISCHATQHAHVLAREKTYHCNDMDARWKSLDKHVVQIVVNNQPGPFEIQRNHCFIVSIVFVAVQIFDLGAMAGKVEKDGIAGSTLTNNVVIGGEDVGFGRLYMIAIVDQYRNIGILKSIKVLNVVVLTKWMQKDANEWQ